MDFILCIFFKRLDQSDSDFWRKRYGSFLCCLIHYHYMSRIVDIQSDGVQVSFPVVDFELFCEMKLFVAIFLFGLDEKNGTVLGVMVAHVIWLGVVAHKCK